ncbi:MAG: hypothetical protein JXB30_08625 [Anaerolineae bacterium]|nr:hypothetical protein [Anaerolineae bacterium]
MLKACHTLSDEQCRQLKAILKAHQGTMLPKAYVCKEAILALFRKSQDKKEVRRRNTFAKIWKPKRTADEQGL